MRRDWACYLCLGNYHILPAVPRGRGQWQTPPMTYVAAEDRYQEKMPYRRCGRSGIELPEISLGLWQNFGDDRTIDTQRAILRRALTPA